MNSDLNNICCLTDGYKFSHWKQRPKGTTGSYFYLEPRVGAKFSEGVFFGSQYVCDAYLAGRVVTENKVDIAYDMCADYFGNDKIFNKDGFDKLARIGYLPISVKAVPEGMVVPIDNVLLSVENTIPDPDLDWLPGYLEDLFVQLWYPCTVATQSREMKKIILKYLHKTGTPELVDFMLHDFGFRGVSSIETSAIGGLAHLLSFKGTDTFTACMLGKLYYHCRMAGFSIPAAEHSTITPWTRKREREAYENMLDQFPTGPVAIVSDSYDVYNACRNIWGKQLKDKILRRDGRLIIRPDSGDPPKVVVEILEILWSCFGGRINEKGYRVLDDHVRVIQGDGIDFEMLESILSNMEKVKFSADNIAFGSGGGLLQKLNRDTQKFAMKNSFAMIAGEPTEVFKDPVTDNSKRSKRGKLILAKDDSGRFYTKSYTTKRPKEQDHLVEIFRNGQTIVRHSLDECRERCKIA